MGPVAPNTAARIGENTPDDRSPMFGRYYDRFQPNLVYDSFGKFACWRG